MADTPRVHGLSRAVERTEPRVPMPPRRWATRVLLPGPIVVAVLGLLAYSAWDSLVPATEVRAVPVVVKAVAGTSPGSVTVQAPGWLEPDPHAFYVSALTGGVVSEVLVLEGEQRFRIVEELDGAVAESRLSRRCAPGARLPSRRHAPDRFATAGRAGRAQDGGCMARFELELGT